MVRQTLRKTGFPSYDGFLTANYYPFKAHLVRAGDADGLYLLLFTLAMLAMLKVREDHRWLYACGLCFPWLF